jgi:hypothetical protein
VPTLRQDVDSWYTGNAPGGRVDEIETRIAQHRRGPQRVATPTRDEFEDLATDLEAVWNSRTRMCV